ncbi:Glyoxalase-like domain protein [Planctomycetes bacterium Pan216]|uniref:Glyoxalase-like domain protein n=1 Tax=Kolteria novifilia TaxID=2527975 RepID=A0A518BAT0_9BACT|nr:Glyoxalase-like domain protein [Planctomycetes bacterium Pan216]
MAWQFVGERDITTPRLNLLVIRSEFPVQTVGFYELLGLNFQEEKHGKGPVHWAAEVDSLVIEVYPAQSFEEVDGTTRIGFEVDDVKSVLALLKDQCDVVSNRKQTQWGLRAVVKDPDGRSVELVHEPES